MRPSFVVAAWLLVALPSFAFASNQIGIYGDPYGRETFGSFAPFTVKTFYIVGFQMEDLADLEGSYSTSIGWHDPDTNPAGFTLVSWHFLDSVSSSNLTGSADNFLVQANGCFATGTKVVLAQFQLQYMAKLPPDVQVCLGAATPSRFQPSSPGYTTCDGSEVALSWTDDHDVPGCYLLNPSESTEPVSIQESSMGFLKARF